MRRLSLGLCTLLAVRSLVGCGQDAEKEFAGLDVLTVQLAGGPGYRVRYQHPPWDRAEDDPLERGQLTVVPFGASYRCEGASEGCRDVEATSARVLEVERSSITQTRQAYPKYRLEAAILRCSDAELAEGDACADVLARQDEVGRKSDQGDDDVLAARADENHAGQPYRELLTRSRTSRRYRRIAYFTTDRRELAFRLFIEATPDLAETEITRMIAACEVLESAGPPEAGDGEAAGSSP